MSELIKFIMLVGIMAISFMLIGAKTLIWFLLSPAIGFIVIEQFDDKTSSLYKWMKSFPCMTDRYIGLTIWFIVLPLFLFNKKIFTK